MAASVRIQGAAELMRKLKALGPKARAAKRRALSAAGKYLVKEFRHNAVVKTGATKRSIGIKRSKEDVAYVGVRHGWTDKKSGKKPFLYAAKVEAKNPWFMPTWNNVKNTMGRRIIDALRRAITNTGV